jgi:hypothetical protein
MARWAGWGAGPASAGAAGPSRTFLALSLVAALVASVLFFRDGQLVPGALAAAAALYFALRVFGLGRRK